MLVEPLRDRTWVIPDPSAPQSALQALKLAQPAATTATAAAEAPTASTGSGGAAACGGAEGLTRNQRKKLKKKMKRAAAKKTDLADGAGDDDDCSDVESTSGMTGAMQSGDPDAVDTAATATAAGGGAEAHAGEANGNGAGAAESGQAPGGEEDAETAARVASGAEATTTAGEGAGPKQVVITRPGLTDEQMTTAACKVVDFGNACWTYKQFTTDVQTRQYRYACRREVLGWGWGSALPCSATLSGMRAPVSERSAPARVQCIPAHSGYGLDHPMRLS